MSSLLGNVAVTFGTYMLADTLSNFILHPTHKMDYGKTLNGLLGRATQAGDNEWWGTRTEHIVGVAAGLAPTDHASQAVFKRFLGQPVTWATAPNLFPAHTVVFIAAGVALYCGYDAMFNPAYSNNRMEVFKENLYATVKGSMTSPLEPVYGVAAMAIGKAILGRMGRTPGGFVIWLAGSLIPATLAYATVKGFGWDDLGARGLSSVEKRLGSLF